MTIPASNDSLTPDLKVWRQRLQQHRAIAVIRSPHRERGLKLAQAIADGGMRLIEITWNSDQPAALIEQLRAELPECTVGTGTIMNVEQLQRAVDAGAEFLFSPHVDLKLIEAAVAAQVPIIPGALSPTEIVRAWQAGASCVKVFPVQAVGGATYIKSLQGPLGQIPLIPTGGVTLDNATEFIEAGAIAVGLSSQLFPPRLVKEQNWKAIAQTANFLIQRLAEK